MAAAESALRSELEAARAELETLRAQTAAATVNSEQAFHRLEQDQLQLKQRNEKMREELRTLRHDVGNAEKQRVVSDAATANLRSVLATKEAEMERHQREARELKEERDGLLSRVTRLLEESRDRNAEMQSYATRLEESYKLRNDLQDKVEELQGGARTNQFELHRTKEAKELGDKHSAWLTEELEIKQKELAQLRSERSDSARDLQQKADDSAEEAAKLAGQAGVLRARADDAEQKTRQLELQLQAKTTAMQ
jgi:chromosome segregation ATPase